jgi:Tol biopolymer transport system component
VSPDEKTLLYHAGPRLYSLRLDDPNAPPQLIAEAYQAKFSPDGHWIVYTHPTNDGREVYVQQFPSGGLPTQLTPNGGQDPVWRGDGQEIFYRKGPKIFAVKVHTKGTTFSAEEPEALFDVRVPSGMVGDAMPMDVSRDGSRILFTQAPEQRDSKTYVMTDWTAKLHQ